MTNLARLAGAIGRARGDEIRIYLEFLGTPLDVTVDRQAADNPAFKGSLRYLFDVPPWSHFRLAVNVHPEGWVWRCQFTRRGDQEWQPPRVELEQLQPWSILDTEVESIYGPFARDDTWNFGRDGVYLAKRGPHEAEITLEFDFGLLQRVSVR